MHTGRGGSLGMNAHVLGVTQAGMAASWLRQTLEDTQTPAFQLDHGNMVAGSLTTTRLISFSGYVLP